MSTKRKIEWTDVTWNPVRGCTRVSPGCQNCYAERQAIRQAGPGRAYEGLVHIANGHSSWTGKVEFVAEHLEDPLHWREPQRVFVNSMSDLFHEGVSDEQLDQIFAVMAATPQHTFQILTKRPERMLDYFLKYSHLDVRGAFIGQHISRRHLARTGEPVVEWAGLPLPNVWLGVSVENQKYADERIPLLLKTPAAVRFISAEPLLGKLDFTFAVEGCPERGRTEVGTYDSLAGSWWPALGDGNAEYRGRQEELPKFDWVICGGESGPGARPMHPDWARSLRDQCQAAGVPFFFKQWGEWAPVQPTPELRARATMPGQAFDVFAWPDGTKDGWRSGLMSQRIGKRAAGALLDGREWREFPEVAHG